MCKGPGSVWVSPVGRAPGPISRHSQTQSVEARGPGSPWNLQAVACRAAGGRTHTSRPPSRTPPPGPPPGSLSSLGLNSPTRPTMRLGYEGKHKPWYRLTRSPQGAREGPRGRATLRARPRGAHTCARPRGKVCGAARAARPVPAGTQSESARGRRRVAPAGPGPGPGRRRERASARPPASSQSWRGDASAARLAPPARVRAPSPRLPPPEV